MNADGSINLNAAGVLELKSTLDLKKYPKISKAKNLEIIWYGKTQNYFLDIIPHLADQLTLVYFKPKNKTLMLGSYTSLRLDNCRITTVEVDHCNAFDISDNYTHRDFKKLIVRDKSLNSLKLSKVLLAKNKKIYDDHIMNVILMSTSIDTFENIFSSCDSLAIGSFYDLTSWIGIGDLDIYKQITLPHYAPNVNNIIHIMLSKVDSIHINRHIGSFRNNEEPNLHVVLKHLVPYFDKITRSEYIMDAAVDLIDAGFDEAAEL